MATASATASDTAPATPDGQPSATAVAAADALQREQQLSEDGSGLALFWKLLQSGSGASADVQREAMRLLNELFQFSHSHAFRERYMRLCIGNLQRQQSVLQSLEVLQSIVSGGFVG